jgi:hypothetical protein
MRMELSRCWPCCADFIRLSSRLQTWGHWPSTHQTCALQSAGRALTHILLPFIPHLNPNLRSFSLLFTFSVFSIVSSSIIMDFLNYLNFFLWGWDLNSWLWVCKAGRHLQSRCYTTWATPPAHFTIIILEVGSCELFAWDCLWTNIFPISKPT